MRSVLMSPCAKRPTMIDISAPTAAASVGVVMPPRMPPIITAGTDSDGMADSTLLTFCFLVRRSPSG